MSGLTKIKLFKLPGIWNVQAGNREISMKTVGTNLRPHSFIRSIFWRHNDVIW